jgi:hypothetical protein
VVFFAFFAGAFFFVAMNTSPPFLAEYPDEQEE